MANLYTLLERNFPADRERLFATLPDAAAMTYAELHALSAGYANALRSLGVSPGDRVAVQAGKGIAMVALYLGCLRAGAIFLPLNPAYTPAELEYFLGDAEPALFVSDPALAAPLREAAAKAGVRRLETLDAGQGGTLAAIARGSPSSSRPSSGATTIWPRSSTRRARPGGRRARCSRHDNLAVERPDAQETAGASLPTTCCSTRCPSSTPTACSSPSTSRSRPALR